MKNKMSLDKKLSNVNKNKTLQKKITIKIN